MNKLIEFIKRIFTKKTLVLNEAKNPIQENYSNSKETFLTRITIEEDNNNIRLLMIKVEQGLIDENKLTVEQTTEIKKLYCDQIADLVNSINNYNLKLNQNTN